MGLKDLLKTHLSETELGYLVRGYDLVGDIAITIIPPELSHREKIIAEAIVETNKKIKVVAKRDGNYRGEFRTIPLTIIGGEKRKETMHVEFGVRLLLNPELVYFSVRSGSERRRVASLVTPGEDVLVMFSGVAPYPLIIHRFSKASTIIGVESNPKAHEYGIRNIALNKAKDSIALYCGDVKDVVPQLKSSYHRIIMPLPASSKDYIPLALKHLKPQGAIHFYEFHSAGRIDGSLQTINELCRLEGREILQHHGVVCGHTSPGTNRICLDVVIR